MNLIFTGDSPQAIVEGAKTMTARFWKQKPPRIGQVITASRGRAAETRFATLKVKEVWPWVPGETDIELRTGMSKQEIAFREGFFTFMEFFEAYTSLNGHHDPEDPERTHYFILFEVDTLL